MLKRIRTSTFLAPFGILVFYFVTHFWNLLSFPVFADEAIYIRWAQLIIDDWHRYLFFAMNDGKTPLFIWSLIPFQFLFANQLFAARFVSVFVGAVQLFVIKDSVKQLGGRPKIHWFAMLLTTILPFWYFYHRVALMDGMLTLFISLTLWGVIHITHHTKGKPYLYIVLTGLFFGLALWSKIPALFLFPSLFVFVFLPRRRLHGNRLHLIIPIGISAFIGFVLFVILRISPSFGQLFHRGTDFTYSLSDVFLHGKWRETIANFPSYAQYFFIYLTIPVIVLSFAGLLSKKYRRMTICFLISGFLFALPIMLLGKMVYARYLLPVSIFFTVGASLSLQALYDRYFAHQNKRELWQKMLIGLVIAVFLANIIGGSLLFMGYSLFDVNQIPFVSSDRAQYLEDWSSGHGITEVVSYIRTQSQNHSIAVATEGRFGTLPDGLLLFFHLRDVHNIYIEGTGEYPVRDLPDFFTQKAKNFDQIILVVNSNRMQIISQEKNLLFQVCRPNNAPCLQVWDVTQLAHN